MDYFITRKFSPNYINIEDCFDLDSDHSAVILTLSEEVIKKEKNATLVNNSTDWASFGIELENKINMMGPLKTKQQFDIEVEKFVCMVQSAAWNYTRVSRYKQVGCNYSKEILDLLKEKREARRRWHRQEIHLIKTS